jgi:hypothetical protein
VEHLSDHVTLFKQSIRSVDAIENAGGEQRVSLNLFAGTLRNSEKLDIVTGTFAAVSLGDVRRD